MRTRYDGPSQDLTVFNITAEAVVARQASIDPFRWPVISVSNEQGPPMNPPLAPPAWWADALLTD
jgi:ribonuclease Z